MRRIATLRLATLLTALCGAGGSACAAIVELRDQATVDPAGAVRLADVARVAEPDALRRAQLERLLLAPSPAAGRTLRLSSDDIRDRLQVLGVNLAEIELCGRSHVLVTGASSKQERPVRTLSPVNLPPSPALPPRPPTVVEQASVQPTIKTVVHRAPEPAITAAQQRRADEVMNQALVRVFQATTAAAAPLRFRCECARSDVQRALTAPIAKVQFDPPTLVAGGPQPVTAWWVNADGEPEEVRLHVWVDVTPQGLGVKQAVPKGYVLQPDDLVLVPLKDGETGLTAAAEIVGKEATRALRAGQALQSNDLAAVPLVRSGDIVTVQVRRPGLVVRRQFKANSGGALHDTITLTALEDSRVRVQAVVTGYHEASLTAAAPESRGSESAEFASPTSALPNAAEAVRFVPSQRETTP